MTYGLRMLDLELVEACDECGFDSRHLDAEAAAATAAFAALELLQQREWMSERPRPGTWSGAEYIQHVIEAVTSVLQDVDLVLGTARLPPAPGLQSPRAAVLTCLDSMTSAQRKVPCPFMGAPTDVGALMVHLIHDVEHHVLDIRRGLAGLALAHGTDVITVQR